MKRFLSIINYRLLLPIASALMLGLTRTPLPLDMMVFVAFVPLFYYFEVISLTETQRHKENTQPIKKDEASLVLTKKARGTFFIHGAIFSTVYMLVSQHWITLVTPGGFVGMLFIFAVVFGLMFTVVGKVYKHKPFLYQLSLIFIWLVFEYMVNFTEFRFPWFNIAYGLKGSLALLQVLEFGGVFFLSFLILGVNYLFYVAMTSDLSPSLRGGRWGVFSIPLAVLLLWFIFGTLRLHYVQRHSVDEEFTISLIQGNIEQDEKWILGIDETFAIYEKMARESSHQHQSDLIVYPEAALTVELLQKRIYYQRMMRLVQELDTPIFAGFPHFEWETKYRGQDSPFLWFNASNTFYPDSTHGKSYYKSILVPFGERTPLLHKFPILWKIQMGQANFEMGEEMVRYEIGDLSFTPLICFEVAFPLYIRDAVSRFNPNFWVNITNDAWFYRSMGTHQHAAMVVFRTIETRKPIFRAANTGYTFWTTPDGTMHKRTQLFERTAIAGKLKTFDTKTPFVSYGYMIPFIFVLLWASQMAHLMVLAMRTSPLPKRKRKRK